MRALILTLLLAIGVGAMTISLSAPEAFANPNGKKCTEPC